MMIPSSSSSLSTKSQPTRPSSSFLSRPPSRNTAQRPGSSLGTRPTSSASTRPQSRFSLRPNSRQARSRLIPQCQTLVTQITGAKEEDDPEDESFREAVDFVVKSLETSTINKAAASVDLSVIDRRISGLALKARLNSQDVFGEALQTAYERLKKNIEEREIDLDQDIKASRLPDHLQLLLELGRPPTDVTLMKAQMYLHDIANPSSPEPTLTWADILAEEPFEGEHWEGVYDQDGADRGEWGSTPSLSPLSSDDRPLDEEDSPVNSNDDSSDSTPSEPPELEAENVRTTKPHVLQPYEDRKQFEELRAKQYWRDDWHTDASLNPTFEISDPFTLGPTLSRVLAEASGFQDAQAMLKPEHYIDEVDMTREILMCLQGSNTTILSWDNSAFKMLPNAVRLVHLSLASQESIIQSLAQTASVVQNLRRFTAAVFSSSFAGKHANNNKRVTTTRSCEAFADAVDEATRGLDAWCAAREEAICRAYAGIDTEFLIVSLLETEGAIRDRFGTVFEVLLEIVQKVFLIRPGEDFARFNYSAAGIRQPAALTAQLLDTLFSNVQQHMERQDTITSDALTRVFLRTAGPTWNMVGKWLKDGMGLGLGVGSGARPDMADELDEEFFIENNGLGTGMMGIGLLDPEFWQEGYALRETVISASGDDGPETQPATQSHRIIPLFLEHVGDIVLSTGKAVGLMRALGGPLSTSAFDDRKTFAVLVGSETLSAEETKVKQGLFSVSVDTLSRLIYDTLLPHCQTTRSQLVKALVEDCYLWKHLQSIEDLFLMRKGDAISHFIDVLFMKMDSTQPWGDFHFLNTAFSDVIEANLNAGGKEWINASLVRLSHRGSREKDRTIKRTVKAIDELTIEYAVPFPLTYIFQPKTIEVYSDIFAFLLQIRRAKSVLERILVREGKGKQLRAELKGLYAMRSRLSWFIITLLNFLTTYVIHAEIIRFHGVFRQATSLDDMIHLHDEHLEKIRGRCLLKPNTSALHRAILSILDMCLNFSEGFVDFVGDSTTTLDLSRQSINVKRHRSRRQRRQSRNVVAFSQNRENEDDTSEEEEEIMDSEDGTRMKEPPEPSFSMGSSTMTQDEGFPARVEKMSSELDGLVRFIRRGVESLAGGTSEAAPAFGILAFSLEDWDM